jgi:hypothetical protein
MSCERETPAAAPEENPMNATKPRPTLEDRTTPNPVFVALHHRPCVFLPENREGGCTRATYLEGPFAQRFANYSELLRHLADHARAAYARQPESVQMFTLRTKPGEPLHAADEYWVNEHLGEGFSSRDRLKLTADQIERLIRLQTRYASLCHHIREVDARWEHVQTMNYADNSTEVTERNRHGQTRTRMTVSPHDDLCF